MGMFEKTATPKQTIVEMYTSGLGLNGLFFLNRQTYNTLKELNIEVSDSLDTSKVSDRLKVEIVKLNNIILTSLFIDRITFDNLGHLTSLELDGITDEVTDYLLSTTNHFKHTQSDGVSNEKSDLNCEFEKYYEITPLNTNYGTILLVVVDEGFLRKVTESKEDLSIFFSDILDYLYSIKALPGNIRGMVHNYLRLNSNEDLLTRIKVSLRSPK